MDPRGGSANFQAKSAQVFAWFDTVRAKESIANCIHANLSEDEQQQMVTSDHLISLCMRENGLHASAMNKLHVTMLCYQMIGYATKLWTEHKNRK